MLRTEVDPGRYILGRGWVRSVSALVRLGDTISESARSQPQLVTHIMTRPILVLTSLVFLAAQARAADPKPLEFRLTFDKAALDSPFTGRVFVTIRTGSASPPAGLNWFRPEPGLAKDVKDWKPGEPLVSRCEGDRFPDAARGPEAGQVLRLARSWTATSAASTSSLQPGNIHSKAVATRTRPEVDRHRRAEARPGLQGARVQGDGQRQARRHREQAADEVPRQADADAGRRRAAAVVREGAGPEVPGRLRNPRLRRQSLRGLRLGRAARPWNVAGTEMIWVVLDPNCRLGHHVFADSANNGPVGKALVEELIPHLEKKYRGVAATRVSSRAIRPAAGAASGCRSRIPTSSAASGPRRRTRSIFRDFQMVDLYAQGVNMFTDADGKPRPLARRNGKAGALLQAVLRHGRVHGPRRATRLVRGGVQPARRRRQAAAALGPQDRRDRSEVAKAWEKYDIRLVLERNWKTLGPKARGQDPRLHGRRGHVLPRRRRPAAEEVAGRSSRATRWWNSSRRGTTATWSTRRCASG